MYFYHYSLKKQLLNELFGNGECIVFRLLMYNLDIKIYKTSQECKFSINVRKNILPYLKEIFANYEIDRFIKLSFFKKYSFFIFIFKMLILI
jgi:hypothetical protein